MDWRKLPSSHPLYDLALWRSLETYDDLSYDEIFDDRNVKELDVHFGSSGYTVQVREQYGEAESIFMRGMCVLFAFALYEELEGERDFMVWTSVGVSEYHAWGGHVALRLDEDHVMDFLGVHRIDEMDEWLKNYGMPMKANPAVLTIEELLENHVSEDHQLDVFGFVDPLEAELTRDFARELANQVKLETVNI